MINHQKFKLLILFRFDNPFVRIFSKENHENDKIYKGFYGNDKLLIENEEEPCYNELNLMKQAEIHNLELESITIEDTEREKLQKNYENIPKIDKIEVLSVGRLH